MPLIQSSIKIVLLRIQLPVHKQFHFFKMMCFHDGIKVGPVNFIYEVIVPDFPEDDKGVGEVIEFCFYAVEAGKAPFC